MIFYILSNLGMYALLAFGSFLIVKRLFYPLIPLRNDSYKDFYFKTIFFVELFLYLFCRSRTSIKFFPLLSFTINYLVLTIIALKAYGSNLLLLNLNFTLQMILFTVFLLVEQAIQRESEKGLIG